MTAGRKLALFLSLLLAICWFASSSLIAQDKEQMPETEQAKKGADEKDKKEEDVRPEGLSESVTVTATRPSAYTWTAPTRLECKASWS